jgi:hypothetical protein
LPRLSGSATASAINLLKQGPYLDAAASRDRLNLLDLADDLELH